MKYKRIIIVLLGLLYLKIHWILHSIGLLAALITAFSVYSWIFLLNTEIDQDKIDFILYKTKTWVDFGSRRNAEVKSRVPMLIQRKSPGTGTDPMVVSKYQKVVGEMVLNVSKDFIQGMYNNSSKVIITRAK